MEIKENEFVRTDNGIFKVTKIDGLYIYLDKQYFDKQYQTMRDVTFKERIVNHSFNIIDLIESIDILVFKIKGCDFISRGIVYEEYDASKGEFYYIVNGHRLEEIQIIKILTHEQYERDCFVVEEEE